MLSIIMVAHNEARFIESSLTAVLADMPKEGELILVDDASTDGTLEIAAKLAGVRLFPIRVRQGVRACRNEGATQAKGDAFCFLDAHVWPEPCSLAHLEQRALETGNVVVPAFTNFETHPKKVGDYWPTMCKAAQRNGPVNYWSDLVFSPRKHWFYLCVDRHEKNTARRRACHACGVTMSRNVFYNQLNRWPLLPGYWSGNDIAFSIKAWFLDIPIWNVPEARLLHAQKSVRSHDCPNGHEVLNRFYTAHQFFDPASWEEFWRPGLTKTFHWPPSMIDATERAEAREEREWFKANKRRTDAEFMQEFVAPRLAQGGASV